MMRYAGAFRCFHAAQRITPCSLASRAQARPQSSQGSRRPTVEDTISILRGLKERYEVHHGVRIKDSALVSAAILSQRYIADRFLPDKAIDLIDEAAAKLRTEIDSMPAELDEIQRRVMQLEIERVALEKEKDAASRERLARLDKELAEARSEADRLTAQWQAEQQGVERLGQLREK